MSQNYTWPATITLPPVGGATAANQVLQTTELSSINTKLTNPLPVSGPLTDAQLRAVPVPISGTVATGALTDTQLRATAVPVSGPLTDAQLRAVAVPVTLTSTTVTGSVAVTGPVTDAQLRAAVVPVSLASTTITGTVAATQSGTFTVQPGNTANTTAWLVSQDKSATATITSISGSATTVSLLASNTSRKNATFFNESTAIAYLKLGTTASVTSYTVQIAAGGYYELPLGRTYTGAIDAIWAAANGSMRITELT